MTQAPDPQKIPLSEQIADTVLKVIKPGGLTGGSLGAIWFLFVESDIPKAIASAVIGVMLSYGAKLLQPIHEGNEQRLKSIGEATNRGIDRVGEVAIAKITSVGQLFDREELLNFPCEELLAMDGLWVKYSKGKFGFSVQKEIYLECGGIPDGEYLKEAYCKFCDRVCWPGGSRWKSPMIYDTSAPKGHLPIFEWGEGAKEAAMWSPNLLLHRAL